jgi:hypothetical protein
MRQYRVISSKKSTLLHSLGQDFIGGGNNIMKILKFVINDENLSDYLEIIDPLLFCHLDSDQILTELELNFVYLNENCSLPSLILPIFD